MKPYFETELGKLYNGDCLEVMDELIKQGVKVDVTITSPPYDDLRKYENTLSWDFEIFKKITKRLWEITKDGGVVVWVVGDKTHKGSESGTSFKQALYFMKLGFNLHDTMIYKKENYMPLNHNRYDQEFEYMFIFSKGKPNTFNPIRTPCKYYGSKYNLKGRQSASAKEEKGATRQRDISLKIKADKYKGNVWSYQTGKNKGSKDDIWEHPATFPEQLAIDHIISWSNENDLVLDCFNGSGTTIKNAEILKRNFIGIEKVEKYCEITKQRFQTGIQQTLL